MTSGIRRRNNNIANARGSAAAVRRACVRFPTKTRKNTLRTPRRRINKRLDECAMRLLFRRIDGFYWTRAVTHRRPAIVTSPAAASATTAHLIILPENDVDMTAYTSCDNNHFPSRNVLLRYNIRLRSSENVRPFVSCLNRPPCLSIYWSNSEN